MRGSSEGYEFCLPHEKIDDGAATVSLEVFVLIFIWPTRLKTPLQPASQTLRMSWTEEEMKIQTRMNTT
jgi:hypothetical protein